MSNGDREGKAETNGARGRVFLSPPHMSGRELELVTEAFASNYIAPVGPMLPRFEKALGEVCGFSDVVAVTSGTAALHLALRLSGVEAGDIVWSPTLTFIGGVSPILYQNATPVFFDCDRYGLIDLDLVEEEMERSKASGSLPKALILTDLYGLACDVARARVLCERHGVALICDSAESLGSTIAGKPAGAGADFAIYSFNGNKIITSSGGGALASNDGQAIALAAKLATQAREPVAHYEHEMIGYNYRLSNICAAIGVGQLEQLSDRVARKREIFSAYRDGLCDLTGVSLLEEPVDCLSNRWLSVMFVDGGACPDGPNRIIAALESEDIEARPIWKPMHLQPVFAGARMVGGGTSEALFETGVCLPSGTAMSNATIATIISIIHKTIR